MVPGGLRPKPVGEESEETTNANSISPSQSPQQTSLSMLHQVLASPTKSRIPPTPRRPSRPLPPLPPLPFVAKDPLSGIGYRRTSSLDLRGRSDPPTSGKENEGTSVSQADVKTMLPTRASSQRELRAVGCRSSCGKMDITTFTRDITTFTRDITTFTRDITTFTRDITTFTRDITTFTRDITTFTRDITTFTRDITTFTRDITTFTRVITTFTRNITVIVTICITMNARENRRVESTQDSPVLTSNPAYRSLPPARVSCAQLESSGRPSMPPPKPPRTFAAAHPIPPSSRASQAVQDKPPLPPRTPVFKLPPTPTAVSQSRPKNALPLPPRSLVWSHAHRDPTRPPLPPGGAKGHPRPPPPLPPSAFARARSPSSSSPPLPPPAARSPSQPLRHLSASSSDLRACAPPNDAPSPLPSPGGSRPATLPRWASLLLPGTRQSAAKKDSEASPNNQRRREPRGSPDPEERRSRPTTGSARGLARWPSAPPAGRAPSSAPKPTVTSYTLMVYTDDSTTPPTTSIFLGPPVTRR
ncbi:proteoglycan 4-like [Penaeus indicus]|uniref:proteoglycan 4-like n=1 Tax=Penaeus indicus TaxID=29960 RepID=UPI00300C4D1C